MASGLIAGQAYRPVRRMSRNEATDFTRAWNQIRPWPRGISHVQYTSRNISRFGRLDMCARLCGPRATIWFCA